MRRVAWRDVLARKLRLALTALAIALGVTLIAGTYVFTDTINGSFKQIFDASFRGTDVSITPDTGLSSDGTGRLLPLSMLERVRRVDGVGQADGSVFSPGLVARREDGRQLKGVGFNAVTSVSPPPFNGADYVAGRRPQTPDQVAIIKATAEAEHLRVGDRLLISGQSPLKRYEISGVFTIGGVESFGGGVIGAFTLPEAQRVAGLGSSFNSIDVAAADGVEPSVLRARIARALRGERGINVRTGAQQADASVSEVNDDFLGVIRTALLAFAGISLFVGAFLIFNTFSITVTQRTREFALLRLLGAKRRQVLVSVIGEGLALGVVGSLVGLGLGVLTARGLRALLKAFGADMPTTSTIVETRTVVVSLVVGIVITALSCIAPALRATRVPPLAALREGLGAERAPGRRSAIAGGVLAVVGAAAMGYGLFGGLRGGAALSWLGFGAAVTFLAVALLSPRLVGPLAATIGAPLARLGVAGGIARENSARQPGRTAVTASALMVGVALVTFASIFAAGAGKTIRSAVESSFTGQAIVTSGTGAGPPQPIPRKAVDVMRSTGGVTDVAAVRFAQGELGSSRVQVTGIDPATFGAVYRLGWKQGDQQVLRGLRRGQILVAAKYADAHHVKLGQTLTMRTQASDRLALRVVGITDDRAGVVGDMTVSLSEIERGFAVRDDAFVMAAFDVAADQRDYVRRQMQEALATRFPGLVVQSNEQFVERQQQAVNQFLALIYALLAMAIVVSLFGIVNTLVLSIAERVRELGLLRAVGMSRRQVRLMIGYESVITALIGAVLGTGLGIVLAVLVTRAVDDFSLAIPVATLALVLVLAALAGVLAAVLPARRAARVDVLEALAYE